MNDCPTCSYPLTWSTDRERVWCSVYGDHAPVTARSTLAHGVYPDSPGAELIRLVMNDSDPRTISQRRTDRHRVGTARRRMRAL